MKGFRSTVSTFLAESTIHGLKELNEPRSSIRLIWAFLFCCALVGMFYQVTNTLISFASEPTVTRVATTGIKSVPPFLFCPSVWTNKEKLRKANLTMEMFHAFMNLSFASEITNRKQNHTHDPSDKVYARFIDLAVSKNWTNVDQVLNAIRFDVDETVIIVNTAKANHTKLPVNTMYGPCYRFEFDDNNFDQLLYTYTSLNVYTTNHAFPELAQIIASGPIPTRIYIGDEAYESLPMGGADVRVGYDYSIKVEAYAFTQWSTSKNPCDFLLPVNKTNMSRCALNCAALDHCTTYFPGEENNLQLVSCMPQKMDEPLFIENGLELEANVVKCVQACPQRCVRWSYRYYAQNYGNSQDTRHSHISIRFANALSAWTMEERPASSWDALFANLGGLVSLWCGASVLSVAQILHYCFLKRLALCKIKTKVSSAKGTVTNVQMV